MLQEEQYLLESSENLKLLFESTNMGVYAVGLSDESCWLSSKVYELLGYHRDELQLEARVLIQTLAFPEDRPKLLAHLEMHLKTEQALRVEVRLLHKTGEYKWYELSGITKWDKKSPVYVIGSISTIEEKISAKLESDKYQQLLEEVGVMAKVGGWELILDLPYVKWSKEVCQIHEVPENFTPSLTEAINFYHPDYVSVIQNAVEQALANGTRFDLELKIITAKKREIWVRALGKPIYDNIDEKKIIGLVGTFQDIDTRKEKELELKHTSDFIQEQNKRLYNFAQIVSHNLRSHGANLQLTLELLNMESDPEERKHLNNNLKKISSSLNQTIGHLNEIIAIQNNPISITKKIHFQELMQDVLATLQAEIELAKVSFKADFSQCPSIEYPPAYLESILLNLISNAIKYRNPERKPQISISSFVENGKPALIVKDNGLGLDLEKYGGKLFGMYKTFHNNPEAKGLGLFMTKNQVEAMGGRISVESTPGTGSLFKINF